MTLNIFKDIFNPKFYGLLKMVFLNKLKKNNSEGKTKVLSKKVVCNDIQALMGMYNEIVFQEFYKFDCTKTNPTIIDCGANIGISALYFHELYPDSNIIAIEPDPEVAKLLKENTKHFENQIEIYQKAAWNIDGEIINFGAAGSDSGSIYSTDNMIQIKTMILRGLLESTPNIDLLKIDIEGAEHVIIPDIADQLSKIKYVFVEFHSFPDQNQGLEDILSIFAQNGFRYKILPARRVSKPFISDGNTDFMDLQLNIFFTKC